MSRTQKQALRYLALGDSYTIGTSVLPEQSYPIRLSKKLEDYVVGPVHTTIIATRGWTTQDLIKSLPQTNDTYDIVTLLIGVNDLYDEIAFDVFCEGIRFLMAAALTFAGSAAEKVVILSIPDYTQTPFAREKKVDVSTEIDRYNEVIRAYCEQSKVRFVDITDISRRGLDEPTLVAGDGLHLSSRAYEEITFRLLSYFSTTLNQNP